SRIACASTASSVRCGDGVGLNGALARRSVVTGRRGDRRSAEPVERIARHGREPGIVDAEDGAGPEPARASAEDVTCATVAAHGLALDDAPSHVGIPVAADVADRGEGAPEHARPESDVRRARQLDSSIGGLEVTRLAGDLVDPTVILRRIAEV